MSVQFSSVQLRRSVRAFIFDQCRREMH